MKEPALDMGFGKGLFRSPLKAAVLEGASVHIKQTESGPRHSNTTITHSKDPDIEAHGHITLDVNGVQTKEKDGVATIPYGANVDVLLEGSSEPIRIQTFRKDESARVHVPGQVGFDPIDETNPFTAQEFYGRDGKPQVKVWNEKYTEVPILITQAETVTGDVSTYIKAGIIKPFFAAPRSSEKSLRESDFIKIFQARQAQATYPEKSLEDIAAIVKTPPTRETLQAIADNPKWVEFANQMDEANFGADVRGALAHMQDKLDAGK